MITQAMQVIFILGRAVQVTLPFGSGSVYPASRQVELLIQKTKACTLTYAAAVEHSAPMKLSDGCAPTALH